MNTSALSSPALQTLAQGFVLECILTYLISARYDINTVTLAIMYMYNYTVMYLLYYAHSTPGLMIF